MANIARTTLSTVESKAAQARHIRSLVLVNLPRFFKPDVYIWNRYSHVDALLVDIAIRQNEKHLGPFRRMALFKAITGTRYNPQIFIEPTSPLVDENAWKTDVLLCDHLQLDGFSVRGWKENILDDIGDLLVQKKDGTHGTISNLDVFSENNPLIRSLQVGDGSSNSEQCEPWSYLHHSFIINVPTRVLSCVIFEYHQLWEASSPTLHMKELEEAAHKAKAMGVQPLARRARRSVSYKDIEMEFHTLKSIGFTGAVIRNPALVNLVHEIFT